MSATEVKCPEEFFVREERRRPRFLMDFFSLALLILGILVFGMACYVFFGCSKMEETRPSALRQEDHNNSEQNVLKRIERMVNQLLRSAEQSGKTIQEPPLDDNPFFPLFQPNNNPPPIRTRLILKFGLPSVRMNSFIKEGNDQAVKNGAPFQKKLPEDGKEPEIFFTQSKIHLEPSNHSPDEENSKESKESSEEALRKLSQSKSFPGKPAELAKIFDDVFKDMDRSFSGFSDPFFSLFKPHFTSLQRSPSPFKNEASREAENGLKEMIASNSIDDEAKQPVSTAEQGTKPEPVPESSPKK